MELVEAHPRVLPSAVRRPARCYAAVQGAEIKQDHYFQPSSALVLVHKGQVKCSLNTRFANKGSAAGSKGGKSSAQGCPARGFPFGSCPDEAGVCHIFLPVQEFGFHEHCSLVTPLSTRGDAPSPGAMPLHWGALLLCFLGKTPKTRVCAESTGSVSLVPRHLEQSAPFLLFFMGCGLC